MVSILFFYFSGFSRGAQVLRGIQVFGELCWRLASHLDLFSCQNKKFYREKNDFFIHLFIFCSKHRLGFLTKNRYMYTPVHPTFTGGV